jgi:hypothetical protein
MKKYQTGHEHGAAKPSSRASMVLEVQVCQPHRDCPVYTWDRERECLLVTDMLHSEPGLPVDLASIRLEGRLEVPVLLLSAYSFHPETLAQARLLGALSPTPAKDFFVLSGSI